MISATSLPHHQHHPLAWLKVVEGWRNKQNSNNIQQCFNKDDEDGKGFVGVVVVAGLYIP